MVTLLRSLGLMSTSAAPWGLKREGLNFKYCQDCIRILPSQPTWWRWTGNPASGGQNPTKFSRSVFCLYCPGTRPTRPELCCKRYQMNTIQILFDKFTWRGDSCSPKGLRWGTFERRTFPLQRGFGCQLPHDLHLETQDIKWLKNESDYQEFWRWSWVLFADGWCRWRLCSHTDCWIFLTPGQISLQWCLRSFSG